MYNKYMCGVDAADALLHRACPFPHKRDKYTFVDFFTHLKVAIDNAYIIFKQTMMQRTGKKCSVTLVSFMEQLVLQQVSLSVEQYRAKNAAYAAHHCHYPARLTPRVRIHSHVCALCRANSGSTSKSGYYCPLCRVCLHAECFAGYHFKKCIF
jgi:hypothetical protein